jgi:hypothetical protein
LRVAANYCVPAEDSNGESRKLMTRAVVSLEIIADVV